MKSVETSGIGAERRVVVTTACAVTASRNGGSAVLGKTYGRWSCEPNICDGRTFGECVGNFPGRGYPVCGGTPTTSVVEGCQIVPTNAPDAPSETIPVVSLETRTRAPTKTLGDRLDPGEAESLADAEHHDGLLVPDDGAARSLARERGVHLPGSIGALISSSIGTGSTRRPQMPG